MKKMFLLLAAASFLVSCNNTTATSGTKDDSTTVFINTADLAYPVKDYSDWRPGSSENLKIALLALKTYENGQAEESAKYFADSAIMEFDYYTAKLSKDSIAAMFKQNRSVYKTLKIVMDDYESVKSKDGKSEFVSLWYKQISEGKDGKTDSVECMNDIKMKDGKIILLNEKTRHYPAQKS